MWSQTSFLSTIYLNAKGKLRPQFAIRYFPLLMQHLELKSVMFASLVASVQNVSLLLCFPHQDMANHLALLFITRRQQSSSFQVCALYHHSRWRFATIAALDKWVRCGVGQMTLLLICSPDFVSKERYESCYRQKEQQLLLDTVLFYDVLKGTAWCYVCLELRKESDSCYICSGCRPLNFEVTNWKLANTAKPCTSWFFPHNRSVPALMTFLSGDIPYTGSV